MSSLRREMWPLMSREYMLTIYSLQDLEDFIYDANEGLKEEVHDGDYDALVRVMAKLLAIKERQAVR